MKHCVVLILFLAAGSVAMGDEVITLPDSRPLTGQEDIAVKMMDGLHRFIERKIEQSVEKRTRHWKRDCSSAPAYEKSVQANRERFRKIIGVVDGRLPARMERFAVDNDPALVAENERYRVYQVRWPVL